jgi:hypothetical protein
MANFDRNVRAGDTIKLRARFADDIGEFIEASDVNLYIFEPDPTLPLDPLAADVSVPNPTYLGQGIYEYEYLTENDATEGTWTDLWTGELNGQTLSGEFHFAVWTEGDITELGAQLYTNNIVEVILNSGIQATDGSYLEDGYTFEFLTTTSPSFTDIRKVRLEVGAHIKNLSDKTIQLSILEASMEANELGFNVALVNTNFLNHAKREWTTCKVALMLLDNVSSGALKSKALADLRVEYDPNVVRDSMKRILACLDKWEGQIIAGGYSKAGAQPVGVIKGEYDPDRPLVGRLWSNAPGAVYPASNTKELPFGSRRAENIFRSKKRWW